MKASKEYVIYFYETGKGIRPAQEYLDLLPLKVRAKIIKWIEKLEEYGPDLPRPFADTIRDKIRELRVIFASKQYRFLYFFHNKSIIITHGFMKKTDNIPDVEIEKAHNYMMDFEERIKKGEIEL